MEPDMRRLDMRGLGQIFWGLLLVFFDFRLNGFDILPDFVGFLMVLAGLSKLSEQTERFRKVKPFAAVCLVLSLFDLYQVTYSLDTAPRWVWGYGIAVGAVTLFVYIAFYHQLIAGIQEAAALVQQWDLVTRGSLVLKWLIAAQMAGYLSTLAALLLRDATVLVVAVLLLGLIVYIAFLTYLRQARNRLEEAPYWAGQTALPYKTVSMRAVLLSCISVLAAIGVAAGAAFLYIRSRYLFTPLDMPAELGLSFHSFQRPAKLDCRVTGGGKDESYTIPDENAVRELVQMTARCMRSGFGLGAPMHDGGEGDRTFTFYVQCASTVMTVSLQENSTFLRVNNNSFFIAEDEAAKWVSFAETYFPIETKHSSEY